jgi:hypothetical protein
MTNDDKVKEKMRKRVQDIAEKTGLTVEQVARAIISWLEATDGDPAAVDKLRLLMEVNPTFEPMDH